MTSLSKMQHTRRAGVNVVCRCQCGVFVRNYTSDGEGLFHPNCGPTLLLNDPANPKMYSCDYDIYCEYECLQLFRAWEDSFVSFNITIPESDPNYVWQL